jgi:BirA family biotin operon repressor/biotin-[acetyl-CoA-carboxylase] ligase|tara:strand:- start:183 stop:746 length:564 start_codon:yes stop_codon:yes gene_type:complete
MKIKIKNYKKVKSTNDVAMKLIKRNILEPTLITTEKQTNGRGRIGKKWISLKGNLFITLFFKFDQKRINFKQFAVLNAFLLKKVISNIISKKIKIKWPNDLLFNKLKFCGILQEVIKFNNFDYLIVGIGLNTNTVPQNKSFKSTCLKNILNKKIDNQKILKKIVIAYEKFLGEKNKLSFSDLKMKYK